MGIVRFHVYFNKPDRVYYSGETMTGRVEIVNNSVIKIRGVSLNIKGEAQCEFCEGEDTFKSSEIYINIEIILVRRLSRFKLPIGEHIYPFVVRLPDTAPSSFRSECGEISYYARAEIDIPFAFDVKRRYNLTVVRPVNFEIFSYLRIPYQHQKKKTFWRLCCVSGPLTIVVRLPITSFATFESIPITLKVYNGSNVKVNRVCVYLRRVISYTAESHTHKNDSKLEKLRLGGGVKPGRSREGSRNIKIPLISYPNLDGCTIIKIDHELHVKAKTSCMHSDFNMRIPVKIAEVSWGLLHKNPGIPDLVRGIPQMPT